MSSATAVTGRGGTASFGGTSQARVTRWRVVKNVTVDEWGDSDSAGYTNRAGGRMGATIEVEGKYDTSYTLLEPGAYGALELGSNGPDYSFTRALCTEFSVETDIDGETVIGWSASFGSDGAYA